MQKSNPQPNNTRFEIRPASPEEAGLFYAQLPAEDERRGAIGHVRMDFGRSGNDFWHTWWPRGPEELNVFCQVIIPGFAKANSLVLPRKFPGNCQINSLVLPRYFTRMRALRRR